PRLSADELALYFDSNRNGAGDSDIFTATRSSTTMPFGSAAAVGGVSSLGNAEFAPTLSGDQRTIYFTSNRTGLQDIWVAQRTTTTLPFSGAAQVTAVNSGGVDTQPFLRADGQELWFNSDRGQPGEPDLFRAAASGA